jgi:hypothetical protein
LWAFADSRLVHLFKNTYQLAWVLLDKEEFPRFAPEQFGLPGDA